MKKNLAFLFVAFCCCSAILSAQTSDPVLMKINGKDIHVSEFEYIYNKNNSNNEIDKKTLDEYVDLFVNFKLKVEEAIAQGLDTTRSFNSELATYTNQLSDQYLKDDSAFESLLKEAYDRKKNEVEVSHILIRIPQPGTSADTLQAFNKAMAIYKRAQKEDFSKLAREVSEDPSVAQNGGYVGWISAMRTPYPFENAAYSLPKGGISKPVRTFIGYHIIKVNDKRTSPGEVKVAHILIFNDPKNPTAAKAKIDSVYQQILSGKDFGEMAKTYSQDQGSARQNGELPWFGSGQMIPDFEKAAFALKEKGEISKPVQSAVGYHIIKLLDKRALGSFDDMKSALENQIRQNDRMQKATDLFASKLKNDYHYTVAADALNDFVKLSDQFTPTDSAFAVEVRKLSKPLFSFGDKTVNQNEFADYLINNAADFRGVRIDFVKEKFNNFVNTKLIAYEQTQLEKKYPDYRNLLKEYHDGILLFDVMNKEVWEKASQDTEGLKKYFEAHKSDYAWAKPHYKGHIIYAKDKETINAAKKIIKLANPDSIDNYLYKRLNDSVQHVKVEKGIWMEGENPAIDASIFKKGDYTPTKDYPYYFIIGKMLKKMPEDYTDVRGVVTANYQDYLEKEWIQVLRNKYPVVVDEKVLKTVKKN